MASLAARLRLRFGDFCEETHQLVCLLVRPFSPGLDAAKATERY
jgi:hypothetical protein